MATIDKSWKIKQDLKHYLKKPATNHVICSRDQAKQKNYVTTKRDYLLGLLLISTRNTEISLLHYDPHQYNASRERNASLSFT